MEVVPNKEAEPNKRLNVEGQHVQEMWLSKQIATTNVVPVKHEFLSNMTKNFLSISICLFQLTAHGIAGNHGIVVPQLVEVVPNKEPGPKIMPCVEVQHVQAMLLSKQIATTNVVLVNHVFLIDRAKNFLSISICLFQLTVLGIAGNHGVVVLNLVEVVPNKEPGPIIMQCVEVQHVQAILLSKRIVTTIVVLVNHF